jgi:phospholipase/carboxylesterase
VSDAGPGRLPDDYSRALAEMGSGTLGTLQALETAMRWLHPPALEDLRAQLSPIRDRLSNALAGFRSARAPDGLTDLHARFAESGEAALAAAEGFVQPAPAEEVAPRVLRSMREHARAQELLYPLRRLLPPVDRYFAEPAFHDRLERLESAPGAEHSVGLHRSGDVGDPDGRGGFCLYVPESYDGEPLPLVVALHGGYGRGRDFLWSWLREARGRRFLLMAPTSQGTTWSLQAPPVDGRRLASMVEYACESWSVDRDRILLTGLSDGATFALLVGLSPDSPYTALAPVSGVLHPAVHANGSLQRAAGRRVHLVHGALDWMFPVALARMARETLESAGCDLTYCEVPDLSHAYPREENDHILSWFDPSLSLPPASYTPPV